MGRGPSAVRARLMDESGWAAPGPSTVRVTGVRPTDDDWIDWAANCDLVVPARPRDEDCLSTENRLGRQL